MLATLQASVFVPDTVYWIVLVLGLYALGAMIMSRDHKSLHLGLAFFLSVVFIAESYPLHEMEAAMDVVKISTFNLIAFLSFVFIIVETGIHSGIMNVVLKKVNTNSMLVFAFYLMLLTAVTSALLDNVSASVLMTALVVSVIKGKKDQLLFFFLVVLAANAGGIPSAVGNTVSMLLWLAHKINASTMFTTLIVPSTVALFTALAFFVPHLWGRKIWLGVPDELSDEALVQDHVPELTSNQQWKMLAMVIGSILTVVVFKVFLHIEPWITAIGVNFFFWNRAKKWIDGLRPNHPRPEELLTSRSALKHIDHHTILMFIILLPFVAMIAYVGLLDDAATHVDVFARWVIEGFGGDPESLWTLAIIAAVIGLCSSVIPNTPMIAAAMTMYSFGTDHPFWLMLCYTTAIGGTLIPMGTGAGMVLMSKYGDVVSPGKYFLLATGPALASFFTGYAVLLWILM